MGVVESEGSFRDFFTTEAQSTRRVYTENCSAILFKILNNLFAE